MKWHSKKNYTTLFIDGNHENHELLNSYPVSIWNGGRVNRINDEEEVTEEQIEEAKKSLMPYHNKVDYILTHTLCDAVRSKLKLSDKESSITEKRLNIIYDQVSYKWWLNGHLHIDRIFPEEKQICLYNTIMSLQEIESHR